MAGMARTAAMGRILALAAGDIEGWSWLDVRRTCFISKASVDEEKDTTMGCICKREDRVIKGIQG